MSKLIEKILLNESKLNKNNRREYVRGSRDELTNRYITLIDEKKNKFFKAKLMDISSNGCRVIVSNMQLFEKSDFQFKLANELLTDLKLPSVKGQVVWSNIHSFDGSRYCISGIQFLPKPPVELELKDRSKKKLEEGLLLPKGILTVNSGL